jgi:localization factor PodJL
MTPAAPNRAGGASIIRFPVTVAKMNRAAAWSVRGIGRETRDAAQEAARRAGVSLGEWLDEVIAEQAAEQGVDASDFDEDQRLDAIGDRLSGLPAREGRSRRDGEDRRPSAPSRPAATNDSWRAEELLDAAIGRFESRAARSDARTARAFDSVASLIERSQDERRDEREALKAVVGRLGSLEEKIAGQQAERDAPAGRRANRPQPPVENGARDLDERMNELSQRISAANKARAPVRGQARDIDDAVLQIARRRQELDARAGGLAPEPESLKRGWRNFGVDAPATRPMPPAPPTRDVAEENVLREAALRESAARESAAQAASAATALQAEIRKLSQRLDEVRREQNDKREAPTASIEALRTELAAMSRSLADLAPRNAVVALEGAIRDLSQRVAASRESGARENLLAPSRGLSQDCAKLCAPMIRAKPSPHCNARSAPSARRSTASPTRASTPATSNAFACRLKKPAAFLARLRNARCRWSDSKRRSANLPTASTTCRRVRRRTTNRPKSPLRSPKRARRWSAPRRLPL